MLGDAGKVRRSTPFTPSKHVSLPEVKRRLADVPQGETDLPTNFYDNQLNRKKQKNGRSKMRSQYNKYVTSNCCGYDDETVSSKWNFSGAASYSLAYPITEQEEEDYTIYSCPLTLSSVNSIQRQFFKAQSTKLTRLRTNTNRKKRRLHKQGKKLYIKKLRALKSAPPLFTSPKPKDSIQSENRMRSLTSIGEDYYFFTSAAK